MAELLLRRVAFSFPADPASIRDMRHLVIAEAHTLAFSPRDLDDIALAVSEAFTNLVQHAGGFRIRGVCEITPTQLEVRFEIEQDASEHLGHAQLPTGMSPSGRGIPLLHLLMPIVEIHHQPNGVTELRLVKPLTPQSEDTA